MTLAQLEKALLQTQADLVSVRRALGTLIVWIAQSAQSPLSPAEAKQLVDMLPPEK